MAFFASTQVDILNHRDSIELKDAHLADDFVLALPLVAGFISNISGLLENHCKLLSRSGMIRTDLGFRIRKTQARSGDRRGWMDIPGRKKEIRLFVNEVTTSTDINIFAVRE